jgi:hypothetical protein
MFQGLAAKPVTQRKSTSTVVIGDDSTSECRSRSLPLVFTSESDPVSNAFNLQIVEIADNRGAELK